MHLSLRLKLNEIFISHTIGAFYQRHSKIGLLNIKGTYYVGLIMGVFHWPLLLKKKILIFFCSIDKSVSNMSTVTDRMTFGIFGSFHCCDGKLYSEYSVVSDVAIYLYSI